MAADLLTRLRDGGGRLVIEDPAPEVRAAWRQALDAVSRLGLVLDGRQVRYSGGDHGDLVVELYEGEHPEQQGRRGRQERLVVPEEVHDWHLAAAGPFDMISSGQLPRARRLVHALARAAEQRGITVNAGTGPHALEFRTGAADAGVDAAVLGLGYFEVQQRRPVLPDVDDPDDGPRYDWQRIRPQVRQVPTGRLVMLLDADRHLPGRRCRFSDTERTSLEDRLAGLLNEIVYRLTARRERTQAAQQAKEDRSRAWRLAMEQARHDFQESRRVAELERQLGDWERADRIRAYCDALEGVHDGQDVDRASWIGWARGHADRLDPRGRDDHAPPEIEPAPQQLTDFLSGWSPYGPEHHR